MRIFLKLVGCSGLILSALIPSSCSTRPGIETLAKPVVRSPGLLWEITGNRYTHATKTVIGEFNLHSTLNDNPSAAIVKLDALFKDTGRPEIRYAAAEIALNESVRRDAAGSSEEFGYLLCAIRLSESLLGSVDGVLERQLVEVYNQSNAELAWLLHQHIDVGEEIRASGPLESITLSWSRGNRTTLDPEFYDTLTPSSRIRVKGFGQRNSDFGIGGSLVGYSKGTADRKAKHPFMPTTGFGISLVSTVIWDGSTKARVMLHDPFKERSIGIQGRQYPLISDPTAAVATAMNATPGDSTGWLGLLRPNKGSYKMGLYSLRPYSADRIPLVLVHGLTSTPQTWREVINACYSDPVIRQNFQILVFFYPTGYSVPHNALSLREQMNAYRDFYDPQRRNPKMRQMVMVGHSMGCILTNFQIRDGGDSLWYTFFKDSPDNLLDDTALGDLLRSEVYFEANPDIARVVFICGPHRGSPLANSWLGRLGANLIRLPFQTFDMITGGDLNSSATLLGQSVLSESQSSINNLKEHSPLLESMLNLPMPHAPVIHSIIGDRGKGLEENSSDGVVPYWSSHLEEAASELIIPSGHSEATRHPECVSELLRILHEHVDN